MKHLIFLTFVTFCLFSSLNTWAQDIERPQPEISTALAKKVSVAKSDTQMVVTAHPLATQAAIEILKNGGSAADAAITAQLVLGLVEPQSSGLGGGAFALYREKSKSLLSYDARETAPQNITPELFLRKDGVPIGFYDGAVGGRSVGTPSVPALLKTLHNNHGKLKWSELFDEAIRLASEGFVVTPRLAKMSEKSFSALGGSSKALAYFMPNGEALKAGQTLSNADYAETLTILKEKGIKPFYQGNLARKIVKSVRRSKNAGFLNLSDMRDYKVIERTPVCGGYRGYRICSMGEPSSGGLTMLQTLGMLERFDLSAGATSRNVHLINEASRLAFADRNYYMADPDFVKTPNKLLLNSNYMQSRSRLIQSDERMDSVVHGIPPQWREQKKGQGLDVDNEGTSNISIIDTDGNMISMTTTIETAFGSRIMVGGFLLNNELTDFSFVPRDGAGNDVSNAPAPRKRPRSSMAPTIIYNPEGTPFMLIGSAGGSNIIGYVAQRIIAILDWNYSLEKAISMPSFIGKNQEIVLEKGLMSLSPSLERLGHKVREVKLNSGLTAIQMKNGKLIGVADPRREGLAQGK